MNLMKLFIEFATQGVQGVAGDIDTLDAKAKKAAQQAGAEAKKLEDKVVEFGHSAKSAFGWASAALMGWVTAGFIGTVEGNLFHESMRELSNEIASIFVPAMQLATDMVRGLTDWFRSLSAGSQDVIMWIVVVAGVVGTFAIMITKLTFAVLGLVAGMKAFVFQMFAVHVSTGGILLIFAAIAAAIVAIGAAIAWATGAFDEKKDVHRSVQRTSGGMEDIMGTYKRVQQTALRVGAGRSDRDVLESIDRHTKGTKDAVERKPPAVGR